MDLFLRLGSSQRAPIVVYIATVRSLLMKHSQCPSQADLISLVAGNVTDKVAEPILDHLSQCSHCLSGIQLIAAERHSGSDKIDVLLSNEAAFKRAVAKIENFDLAERHTSDALSPGVSDPHGATVREAGNTPGENVVHPIELGDRLGRYCINRVIGKGGFGCVYLAQDEELKRDVALKVPHAQLLQNMEHVSAMMAEARMVASLDHAGIVPVYDVGTHPDSGLFIVSKFIDGISLKQRIKQQRLQREQAVRIVASLAAALQYAHTKGLVHRDVKPANVLLDNNETPYLVDFGLALSDDEFGKGPQLAGTPAYMSPEQARGEGHRVDGRSDV